MRDSVILVASTTAPAVSVEAARRSRDSVILVAYTTAPTVSVEAARKSA